MKRVLILLGMAMCVTLGHAQNNKNDKEDFDNFRREAHKEFGDFRKEIIEEYAEFLREAWKEFYGEKPIPKPKDLHIEPLVIPKLDMVPKPKPRPIVFDNVIRAQPINPQPEPVEPIDETPVVENLYKEFSLFGTDVKVRVAKEDFVLNGVSENDVADAVKMLADERFNNTIVDCLELRESLQLCDWAYMLLLKNMAEAIYGKDTNKAVLFMSYVYMVSGYKMRFASDGTKLYMMYASDYHIYNNSYFLLDGEMYYSMEELPNTLHISDAAFKGEKSMSLQITKEPIFTMSPLEASSHESIRNPDMKIVMKANKNMLDFYSAYPSSYIGDNVVSRWAIYANMPTPRYVSGLVYPQLQNAIAGADQLTAVNRILNWVQTGFDYEYDSKVWGYDRAFFPEESLHYPYCDCEDRAILLTRLIRDLLGLKCILVFYPGHLAAAVEITEGEPKGDYIDYMGHRYYITDGTIMGYGAPLGVTMRGMNNNTAQLILLE